MPAEERIRSAVEGLKSVYQLRSVSIFGSYAEGRAAANSDLDLLVEFDVPAVSAAKGKQHERRMVGAFDIGSGGSLPDNGRMLVAETDAAAGAAILYGEPKPEYPERHGAL